MIYNVFVGIDVSKSSLDLSVITRDASDTAFHMKIENCEADFNSCLTSLSRQFGDPDDAWLFCLEHTGVYAVPICMFLAERGLTYTLVPAVQIQRSIGMRRGKSDKSDSLDIAKYACRFCDQITIQTLPAPLFQKLQILLSERDRLVAFRQAMDVAVKEIKERLPKELVHSSVKRNDRLHKQIDKEIKAIEKEISELIKSDDRIFGIYKLITSVPGVGDQTAYHLLLVTRGFTSFDNPRKLACYCGVAPFEHSSGTSVKGKTRVSHFANKKLKTLLSMCAVSSIQHDAEIAEYYRRKVESGKNKMSVQNAVRNKIIYRVFAVVSRGTPFVRSVAC